MVDVHCTRRLRCGRCAATLPITVVAIVASHWHTHTHTHRCLAHVRIWRPRMCFSVRHSKLSSCQVQFASASTAPVRPQPRPMPSTVSQFPASHPHVRCAFSFATIASIPSRNTSALSLAISTSISVGNRVHTICPALSQRNKSLLLQHRFICSIIHYRNRTHGGGHGNLPAITFARPIGMLIALATSWWWCWSSSVLRIRKPANCITRRVGEQVCKCHASRCTRARTSAHAHVPIGANCLPPIGIDYSA